MVGVLRHNANRGCRTCTISNDEYNEILNENNISIKKQLSTKYGLRLKCSILDKLQRERHLQTPQDIYHATAGKIGRLLKLTCELFSQEGEKDFLYHWKTFEKSKNWSRLPNSISNCDSFMMSDLLRLAMIMPFILQNFLKVTSLKNSEFVAIKTRLNINNNNLILNHIISCWMLKQ